MAGRPSGEKTRCSGQWTEARFNSFIKSALRGASRKWKPLQDALKNAREERGFYRCASCKELVPATIKEGRKRVKNVHADHIVPIVDPRVGFTNWDDCVERMMCESDNFQALCKECHDKKCSEEKAMEKERRALTKEYPTEHKSWVAMRQRCLNKKDPSYDYYGGRGITICPEWESFEQFVKDMGRRPEGFTIERIDVDGNYEPDNCKWADKVEQARNRRNNKLICIEGEYKCVAEWLELYDIPKRTYYKRLARGWDELTAITTESTRSKPHYVKEKSDGV